MNRNKPIMAVTLFVYLFLLISSVFGSSDNWVEVANFSQDRAFFGNTNSFTIEHSDWRINWEYEKTLGDLTAFMFEVRVAETNQLIGNWNNSGKIDITKGVLNISGYEGEFYLWIGTNANHTLIVEQNIDSALTSEINWVNVASFNGTIWAEYTERFSIDYFDWRIKWSYTPRSSDIIAPLLFRLDVKNASGYTVEFFLASNQISGTLNMNQTGEYYLYVDPMHAENYSITVEQNIDSIPEFPSLTILPIFSVLIISVFCVRSKLRKRKIK